jgi:sec-independent protein translocase protein TatB
MFDLGMGELLVIGVTALIVVGPKELPELFRSAGKFTAKMRSMARDFSRAMEAAADETGVKDVARDLKAVTSAKSMGLDAVKDAAAKFEKWDPMKNAARPTTPVIKAPAPVAPITPAAPVTPATPVAAAPVGPATQALVEKKAARQAVLQEAAAKLRAVEAPVEVAAAPAPAKAPRVRKPKAKAPEAGT